MPTNKGLAVYEVVKDKQIAQAELTGQWEKRLEEIRSGSSVKDFKSEITEYTKMITNELLIAGASISGKLNEEKKLEKA